MANFNSAWEWYSQSGKQKPPYAALIALHGGCLIRMKGQPDVHHKLLNDARRQLQLTGFVRFI